MNRQMLATSIVCGFILDQILGDPEYRFHPVRLLGRLIGVLEKRLYPTAGKKSERELFFRGACLSVLVCAVTAGLVCLVVFLADKVLPVFRFVVWTLCCYFLLAAKDLKTESMRVYHALAAGELIRARQAVSRIVGRDTETLSAAGTARAAVETVAENTSDGVVAPLFYLALGGPVGGWLYKAVNTMDSMVGYKNARYLYFGRFAARLDDLLNFIPARLSAGLMLFVSWLLGYDWKNAARIFARDRLKHASPNSAQTESVCAGALRVMLAGDAYYFGRLYKKETIGDDLRPVEAEDIRRANRLMYGTALSAAVLAVVFELLVHSLHACR
ncbi:MAG: cobalamin biosynthesis protein CobD [Lachnospiraceae bacterium]|nr:cobalamin biosynthesis protein CobD [Lachnospiraceae bacterium]